MRLLFEVSAFALFPPPSPSCAPHHPAPPHNIMACSLARHRHPPYVPRFIVVVAWKPCPQMRMNFDPLVNKWVAGDGFKFEIVHLERTQRGSIKVRFSLPATAVVWGRACAGHPHGGR